MTANEMAAHAVACGMSFEQIKALGWQVAEAVANEHAAYWQTIATDKSAVQPTAKEKTAQLASEVAKRTAAVTSQRSRHNPRHLAAYRTKD